MKDKAIDSIFSFMAAIPDIPQNKRGIEYTSKCVCGGTITAIRSKYNGHLHASCDSCKRRLME